VIKILRKIFCIRDYAVYVYCANTAQPPCKILGCHNGVGY